MPFCPNCFAQVEGKVTLDDRVTCEFCGGTLSKTEYKRERGLE